MLTYDLDRLEYRTYKTGQRRTILQQKSTFTAFVVSDGRRSAETPGAPNVRFFVAANSAASLVSMLESDQNQQQRLNSAVRRDDAFRRLGRHIFRGIAD